MNTYALCLASRMWLRLQFLASVTDLLPVIVQRNVPTIDMSSRYDKLCLKFSHHQDFYLVVELQDQLQMRFHLLQVQSQASSPLEYSVETTDLSDMHTHSHKKRRTTNLSGAG